MTTLSGKKGLVIGIANAHSLAMAAPGISAPRAPNCGFDEKVQQCGPS